MGFGDVVQKIKTATKDFFKAKTMEDYIKEAPYENNFLMTAGNFKQGLFNAEGYIITDIEKNPLFYIKKAETMKSHKFFLLDASHKQIGVVKKKFFTISNVLDGEHETKKCIITVNSKTSTIRTFLQKEGDYIKRKVRKFKTTDSGIQITASVLCDEFKFTKRKGPKTKIYRTALGFPGNQYLISHDTATIDPTVFMLLAAIELMLYN